jgi:hypothetical protein
MTDVSEPLVRAGHLQEWVGNLRREPEPWRAAFFRALPRDALSTIGDAARLDWLPVRLHVLFADLMAQTFGPIRSHDYYRRAFAAALRGPFFAPIVRTGARLLGLTPAPFVRWSARGWEASYKHCGALHGEVLGPLRGRVAWTGLPAVCTASDPWLESAQASAYGIYDLVGVTGVVRCDRSHRAEGRLDLELEWVSAVER